MLKALELVGFKSFADKTRFEFPAGITVVVGPNGSGKSNIVDAIKWVLGEQSAKSLRGKDMADVIFKGSGGGRKPMNTAEATIVIDNADGRLPIAAEEVHVTRRVYRSGEGEYLINGQASRLRDIRDLFRGTGVGTDAYSLIEQGKVERLVEASPRDRRAIFEEAAGISRFKAKKVEAQRRLERVDQNMLRLSDIVEEVESRLRSVRNQATKARRYKEYSERLQQLRTQVGLTDWRHLTDQLQALEADLTKLKDEADLAVAQVEAAEAKMLELEVEAGRCGEAIRRCEGRMADDRERIAGRLSTVEHQRSLCHDLAEAETRYRRQLAAMSDRAGDLKQRLSDTQAALAEAESNHVQATAHYDQQHRSVDDLSAELDRLRDENTSRRDEYLAGMRQAAALGNRVGSLGTQYAAAQATAENRQSQLQQIDLQRESLAAEIDELEQQKSRLDEQLTTNRTALEAAREVLTDSRRWHVQRQQELTELKGRFSGASQRVAVLEELEKNFEGLGAGVKQLLTEAAQDENPALRQVRGLVAEQFETKVELAPLVDVALGEYARHVVVAGSALLDALRSESWQPQGRVGLVQLDLALPSRPTDRIDLAGQAGVVGRLDRLVEARPECESLVGRLLGSTWLVESLGDALALARSSGRGLRFVTRQGELLEADGTLMVGVVSSSSGLVSRRSQLRALREEIAEIQRQMDQVEGEITRLEDNVERQQRRVDQLSTQQQQLSEAAADHRIRSQNAAQRSDELEKQNTVLAAELAAAQHESEQTSQQLEASRAELATLESSLAETEAVIREVDLQLETIDRQRHEQEQLATSAQVALAKSEQRLTGLRAQMLQFEEDRQERDRAIKQARDQLVQSRSRQQEAERTILRATSEVAELALRKEASAREAAAQSARREQITGERAAVAGRAQQQRKQLRKLEDLQNEKKLEAGDFRHQRSSLADRLREDYGIELAELEHKPSDQEQHEREVVEEEIASLRRKIANIGAVNMDALAELEELESRFESLSGQYQDLTQAKQALERIIHKINADSRRLFSETLEAIRANFQTLYRKVFGGGRADIVLEEGIDILEAGVEIISNPPGKPSFSNSLLSGGEKALTALALLMAIFQHQPSPFCVLDEVDAPWDESNIGRFIDVLKEFLGWTRFVIVTHSKKTMTAATTLYGVTMQESGVSKRVSVRFDDVSEDGHIAREALDRQQQADDDERAA